MPTKKLLTLRRILIVMFLPFLGISLVLIYQIWNYFSIKSINSSRIYYQDFFGNIYWDATTGCFDICFVKTFKKLPVNKNTFTVLMTKSLLGGKLIDSDFAKDKIRVFYRGKQIIEADPSSFKAVSNGLGKDKNQYFIYGKPLHIYITELTEEIGYTHKFAPELLDVISFYPSQYLILKANNSYYYVKLNPQPKSIEEITPTTASKYPKLQ